MLYTLASVLAFSLTVVAAPIQIQLTPKVQHQDPSAYFALKVDGSLKVSGRVIADEYVQIGGIAIEGSECALNGLVGQDGGGRLLTCQMGMWLYPKVSTEIKEHTAVGYQRPTATVSCGPFRRVIGGGGECSQPSGSIYVISSKPHENGWKIECDGASKEEWGNANVWAICAY
ncbi:hypothetical protein BGX27_006639 [Mortierella sp. AM989]|nr:hypothetical protein BGX27_006639 [Mortierella sp. AM989]